MQSRIVCSLQIYNGVSGWTVPCMGGSSQELYIFYIFLTGATLNNLIHYNIMA